MTRCPKRRAPRAPRRARGFSLVEMQIALAISAALLTSTFAALHAAFKHYQATTESASTHVVTRMVVQRLLTMIRTGTEFGPIPADVFDEAQNPIEDTFIEFVSQRDAEGGVNRVTRVEFRPDPVDPAAPGELWYMLLQPGAPPLTLEERPLMTGIRAALFRLHFNERTFLLDRAEIDITVEPNDSADLTINADSLPQTIRIVASAAPRQSR